MTKFLVENINPKQYSPLSLAFIGDSVYELLVREYLIAKGNVPANVLHKEAIKLVCGREQAKVFIKLENMLSEEELSILKRGRNANSTSVPKSCDVADYRKATGVEALFGYLYLKGDIERIKELFQLSMGDELGNE